MIINPLPARRSDSAKSPRTTAFAGVRIKTLRFHQHSESTGFRATSASGAHPARAGSACNTTSARRRRRVARAPADSPAAPAGWPPGARPRAQLRAAALADLARSSAIPRSLAPRTRPPVPQGPSRPPWRLSMIRCRVAKGCHGGRRRVGRSCSQSWGQSLKQRKKWPSWTVGSRGNEARPRGGGRVTGGGPPVKSQAGPPRLQAERDVGGSPRSPRCLGTPPCVIDS